MDSNKAMIQNDYIKTRDTMLRVMPGHLETLIENINKSSDCEHITCVITDICFGWALELAQKMDIPRAAVLPYAPGNLALTLRIPNLVEAGAIDSNGTAMTDELISISEEILPWKANELAWSCPDDLTLQKIFFDFACANIQNVRISNWQVIVQGSFSGSLKPEDSTCLSWLDKQPTGSVIYVSLGSTTILNQQQFEELALGLEFLGQPFLWVVRSDLVVESLARFPDGFKERIDGRGKIVEWAPQEKVLAKSSVACFVSHCGWNSTLEGWKIGLELTPDENGIVTRQEIQRKVTKLLSDDGTKTNSLKLKERARRSLFEGGSSFNNFERFIVQGNKSSFEMVREPHLLLIPYPAQGHVPPLLKLASKIAEHGIKVTFVNTEFNAAKIMATMPEKAEKGGLIRSFEGADQGRLTNLMNVSPSLVLLLIFVSDGLWNSPTKWESRELHLFLMAPPTLAVSFHVKKIIDAGIIDNDGYAMPMTDEWISISEETHPWKRNEFNWSCPEEPMIQKIFLEITCAAAETVRISNWVLSNSIYELDSPNCDLVPKVLPIGPLLASNHSGNSAGSLIPEDSSCLRWLDKQAVGSVIYVALGSTTTLNQQQFEELALGLESSGQPFLWVVRSNLVNESLTRFPNGFKEKLAGRGKIVEWAAQEKVLAHSSVACFLSHCGWNSTTEGLSMGVPFLCWPYFADQYQNRRFICEVWKIGLDLTPDENGIVTRHEIQRKVRKLISDDGIKSNSLKIKEMARKSLVEGGSSFKNFERFISQVKSS
ncbi:hypothetical protein Patl1_18860 [Pistacia atlantica]|uniref:Uncharacterized protein n=1 Tax=Pistacia atlantica TaxID=434234 RepID=A0ACC1BZY0_9ROSI|nr:hypothetical protein Patl1_18860 [Pistacia atlantica]